MNGRAWFIPLLLATALASGCGRDMADLDAYVAEVKARPGGRIEPLPEIKTFESFVYEPGGARSPFVASMPDDSRGALAAGVRPDQTRKREFLESFPLDTLGMVGTLNLGGTLYGLVQTSDKLIHRVTVGNYLGQNDGRIVAITDSDIQLIEIIPDGLGGYTEREASVSLGET
jgi:type IV pilus assembly protein PilP